MFGSVKRMYDACTCMHADHLERSKSLVGVVVGMGNHKSNFGIGTMENTQSMNLSIYTVA
jgi:hypothetical protein